MWILEIELKVDTSVSFLNAVQRCDADVYSVGSFTEWIGGDRLCAAGEHEGCFGFSKGRRFSRAAMRRAGDLSFSHF